MGGLGKTRLIKVLVLGGDSGGSGAPSGGHEENGSSGALPSSTDAHEWKGWAKLRDVPRGATCGVGPGLSSGYSGGSCLGRSILSGEKEKEGNGPSLSADPMLRKDTENDAIHFKNGQRYIGTCKPKENGGHGRKIKVNFFFKKVKIQLRKNYMGQSRSLISFDLNLLQDLRRQNAYQIT